MTTDYRTIKNTIGVILFVTIMALPGRAAMISLSPSESEIAKDGYVFIDIMASGLGGLGASAFNLTIEYDPDILQFETFTASEAFGDLGGGYAEHVLTNNTITFDVVTEEESATLLSLQDEGMNASLGTIKFKGIDFGISMLSFINLENSFLGDVEGNSFAPLAFALPASVSVPEPSLLSLLGIGLASLLALRGNRRQLRRR